MDVVIFGFDSLFPHFFVLLNHWSFMVIYFCTFSLCPSWSFNFFLANWQARQSLIVRGLVPMLADPRHPVSFQFKLLVNSVFGNYQWIWKCICYKMVRSLPGSYDTLVFGQTFILMLIPIFQGSTLFISSVWHPNMPGINVDGLIICWA